MVDIQRAWFASKSLDLTRLEIACKGSSDIPISFAQNSASGLRIGVCVVQKANERAFDSPESWGLDVASGCRVNGGACALGHPIGASGALIIVTLSHALEQRDLKRWVVVIYIGGGEGTAIAIERP